MQQAATTLGAKTGRTSRALRKMEMDGCFCPWHGACWSGLQSGLQIKIDMENMSYCDVILVRIHCVSLVVMINEIKLSYLQQVAGLVSSGQLSAAGMESHHRPAGSTQVVDTVPGGTEGISAGQGNRGQILGFQYIHLKTSLLHHKCPEG